MGFFATQSLFHGHIRPPDVTTENAHPLGSSATIGPTILQSGDLGGGLVAFFVFGSNGGQWYRIDMTATQVIKEIETLNPVERREVFAFIHHLEAHAEREHKAPAFMEQEAFQRAADAVFGKHDALLRKLA